MNVGASDYLFLTPVYNVSKNSDQTVESPGSLKL